MCTVSRKLEKNTDIRKLRSPNFVRVRGITRSPRVAERRLVHPKAAVTGAQTSLK